jgi:DNA replication protein DnaC
MAQQQNTMESVKHYLQIKDVEKAIDSFKQLRSSFERKEVVGALKEIYLPPKENCEICGGEITYIFFEFDAEWKNSGCLSCKCLAVKKEIIENCKETMIKRGISKRYLDAKLSDFPDSYSEDFVKDKSVYIYGPRGTGKTHLMAGMMKYEILKSEPTKYVGDGPIDYFEPMIYLYPLFITVPELLLMIRDTFNRKTSHGENLSTESDIIEKYSNVGILYLDDLGTEKPSDWAIQVLYLLIDRRYSEMKRTVISSNLNLNEIADRLDDRISSRIAGMCEIIKMEGKDRRLSNY